MKIISMTDFVLEEGNPSNTDCQFADKVMSYANFLKQPLELWMFVPCDEERNLWTHPPTEEERIWGEKDSADAENSYKRKVFAYQQAKERCLFKGFEYQKQGGEYLVKFDNKPVWVNWNNSKTIEDLIYLKPTLTKTAIKQIGL